MATGDLDKARQTFKLLAQNYPREETAATNLGVIDVVLGDYEDSLKQAQDAFKMNPSGLNYSNLISSFITLNRLDEAKALSQDAQAKKLDSGYLRIAIYQIAFLQNDKTAMAQQVAWSVGKTGVEDVFLGMEADTAAYGGQLRKARDFTRQAAASAERADEKETAASYLAEGAQREALVGNSNLAQEGAAAALRLTNSRDVQFLAAMALRCQQAMPARRKLWWMIPRSDSRKTLSRSSSRTLRLRARSRLTTTTRPRRLKFCNRPPGTNSGKSAQEARRPLYIRCG